ncbi:MAG TPA: hypothetical protein PLV07_02385 [Acidiphilium sp.]|jgi:hypothetical protein|uniref:hypothetical protein n=1 Tax=unclassified Acidiphilium TaxID=2617493 RepID=UPI000BD1C560|nr:MULTISPECIES: hypothetical protein [unclassified Acidiphilium]OYV87142.1 MAG: hypothetical protein B7Z64_02055 [Acidiphilium sp. 21-68-69]OYV56482.1 MAG: hypothetical protein B7Z76_06135 [Acidiphilium sp. 20-67-58]HQT59834.1 hypothetical protein [Acidiphilium sp.]HQT73401.1 hypothetical protein [Acidiphilium sp.]HQU10402.1 hypothetical protein [Acidiphilium sp.]
MRRFLLEIVSDAAGRSDGMALLSVLGVLSYIFLGVFAVVVRGQRFEPDAYGMGLGSAIAAGAFGMGLKARLAGGARCQP